MRATWRRNGYYQRMSEPAETFSTPRSITFVVTEEDEGGYSAVAYWPGGHSLYTQGDDLEDLRRMARDCVACAFGDEEPRPSLIHLHFVRDEVLAA